jgi:hypothetical protein
MKKRSVNIRCSETRHSVFAECFNRATETVSPTEGNVTLLNDN